MGRRDICRYNTHITLILEAIRSLNSDVSYNTQLIQTIIPLDLQSLLIGKMQETNKAETSAYIGQCLLRINSIQPSDNFCKFPWLDFLFLLLQLALQQILGGDFWYIQFCPEIVFEFFDVDFLRCLGVIDVIWSSTTGTQ